MAEAETGLADYAAIEALTESQIEDLHRMYQNEWWTKGRRQPDIVKMLRHTDLLFGFAEKDSKRLVAFARVLTDRMYKAVIFDVIVDPAHRGTGLGAALMDCIVNHPELRGVRHIELYCKDELIPFYERWQFTAELPEVNYMRRTKS